MKELADIVLAYEQMVQTGKRMALATVVQVDGSSYRRPGARMLVSEDGQYTGAISGGCLEGDALRKAALAITQGKKKLVVYDTTDEDDAKLGVQLGCNGVVRILFEPIDPTNHTIIDYFKQISQSREPSLLITGYQYQDAFHWGTNTAESIPVHHAQAIQPVIDRVLMTGIAEHLTLETTEGLQELFIEYLVPAISLIIVGAGNDTIPLESMARLVGWKTTVVDGRPTHANRTRFAKASEVLVGKPSQVLPQLQLDNRTALLLMTHNYNYDIELLGLLHAKQLPYIGLLGPAAKRDRMLQELMESGKAFDKHQLKCLYGPTGLDIGAETSAEIALSVCAEIMAVLSGKQPIHLRDKLTPIHALS